MKATNEKSHFLASGKTNANIRVGKTEVESKGCKKLIGIKLY